jgi:hypothetical protein
MKLLAGGCSLIYGSEMPDECQPKNQYSQLTYTALLAKKFNLEYMCVAAPGAGNDAISRRVIENIDNQVKLVIVNWSYHNRFEFNYYDIGWQSLKNLNTQHADRVSQLAKPFYSELTYLYSWYRYLQDIILLQTFLIKNKIPYVFSSADNDFFNTESTIKFDMYYKQLYDLIDFDNWFYWKDQDRNCGFVTWAQKNQYPLGDLTHPLELAHFKTYELLKPQVENLL